MQYKHRHASFLRDKSGVESTTMKLENIAKRSLTWCNLNKRANNRIISKVQLYISIYQARLFLKGVFTTYFFNDLSLKRDVLITNGKSNRKKARKESE